VAFLYTNRLPTCVGLLPETITYPHLISILGGTLELTTDIWANRKDNSPNS